MDAKGTIKLVTTDSKDPAWLVFPIEDMGLNPGGFWVKGTIRNVPGGLPGRTYQQREVYDADGDLVWVSTEDFYVPNMTEKDSLTLTVWAKFNSVDGNTVTRPIEATDENIVATIETAVRILKDTA